MSLTKWIGQTISSNFLSSLNLGESRGNLLGSYDGGHGSYCCPKVVDPYTWIVLIGGIALATYFLRVVIVVKMPGSRKRRAAYMRGKNGASPNSNLVDNMFKGMRL